MSSTNNISEKDILSYYVSTLSYWGVNHVNQEHFKKARKNHQEAIEPMKKTLFQLAILHMFSYKYKITQIFSNHYQIKDIEMQEILMAYLTECQCPFLLEMQNKSSSSSETQNFMGCNFQSSRSLLLLIGWVMAISDYFNQIFPNYIEKLHKKINEGIGPLDQNQELLKKATAQYSSTILNKRQSHLNPNEKFSSEQNLILRLYKSIETRSYHIQCLQAKKKKILHKVSTKLKQFDERLSINDLSVNQKANKDSLQWQRELKYVLENQNKHMKQRKYFWTWLEEKVLKEAKDQLKSSNPHFVEENIQVSPTSTVQVDLEYLEKYCQLCDYYQQKYNQIQQKLSQMKFPLKKSREIANQVNHDIFNSLQCSKSKYQSNKKHMFIALQLKDQLNLINRSKVQTSNKGGTGKSDNSSESNNEVEPQIVKNNKQKSKLIKKQLESYLKEISDSLSFL